MIITEQTLLTGTIQWSKLVYELFLLEHRYQHTSNNNNDVDDVNSTSCQHCDVDDVDREVTITMLTQHRVNIAMST
jgi:hypothetical protein